ncbi:hypothetical protein [Streptomyces mirabilis]|uniref:hypothetical protein n=1 Tax=Streptomyces mirabilis TaxID=68239 RepID=UPI00341F842B
MVPYSAALDLPHALVEWVISHHRALQRGLVEPQSPEPEPEPEPPEPAPASAETATADAPELYPTGKFLDRLRDTHAAVRAQVEQGLSLHEIARRLGLGRNTVREYARAVSPETMLHGQWQNRTSKLDPFRPYIEQRITEGCTNLSRLHGELRERGARCSILRDYVHPLRPGRRRGATTPPMARPASPRQATRWIMATPTICARMTSSSSRHCSRAHPSSRQPQATSAPSRPS